ncbi:MAG TPA: Tad domain-containing protein [Anaerolineales bacterium]|nr:Tad domain-containing protein [Anaerolineales bacterium]
MKPKKLNQRGQALVLIALAIVGLVGFTALAIDGGNVFSDRRHAQNASDTASLAAALALTRNETNWRDFGFQRALNNGYDPSDGVTAIDVYLCSELPKTVNGITLSCTGKGLPAGADPAEYVYVHIKSRVKLFFAPVIGWREVINNTDAVARTKKQQETSLFPGYAIVSTMMNCPAYNHDPFTVNGNSGTTIINAGILVNATCSVPQPAYDQGGSSSVKTDTGVCVVGAAESTNTIPPPTTNCTPIDVSKYTLPNPNCSHEGEIVKQSDGEYMAWPGLYGPNFNFDSIDDVTPSGTLRLQKGIYCFYDGIDLNSTWQITTDLNHSGDYDSASEGVFFFVPGGDITFNGSSEINIHAIDSTTEDFPKEFVNYLIYVPPTNDATVKITGANGSQYTGTILAPTSYLVLNGGSGTVGLDSQIIGYAVAIEGNGTLDINYKANNNAITTTNPGLEQTE